jgi:diguanylate cyclase (GGDEF)-like protein
MDVTQLQAQFIRSFWVLLFLALGAASLLLVSSQQVWWTGRAFTAYLTMVIGTLIGRWAARFSRRWAITSLALGLIPLLAIFLSAPELASLLEVKAVGRVSFGAPSTLLMGVLWGWPGALVTIISSVALLGWGGNTAELLTAATLLALVGFSGSSVGRLIRKLESANQRLEDVATRDAMTGLGNRRALETLPALTGQWLVTMWDVDGLKSVNDTQGHAAGDAYLLAFVRALESATAASDRLFRVGGDEFMGLHQNFSDAAALEARVRRNFRHVSMGWAELKDGTNLQAVMLEADRVLYAVKQSHHLENRTSAVEMKRATLEMRPVS